MKIEIKDKKLTVSELLGKVLKRSEIIELELDGYIVKKHTYPLEKDFTEIVYLFVFNNKTCESICKVFFPIDFIEYINENTK